MKIRPVAAEFSHAGRQAGRRAGRQAGRQTDRQTCMAKIIVSFRNFANAPKKGLLLPGLLNTLPRFCSPHVRNLTQSLFIQNILIDRISLLLTL
jgi:hypothetical protein